MSGPGGGGARGLAKTERNNEIRAIRATGVCLQVIADRYGITRERVRQIVGPALMVCPLAERGNNPDRIQELYDSGLTDPQIGRKLGMSKYQIFEWRKLRGLPPQARIGEFASRMEMYSNGMSDVAIGKVEGVWSTAIAGWRHRRGLPPNYDKKGRITDVEK